MTRPDLTPLAEAERRDLADLLTDLEPEEWEAPTLCTRWRVKDVVAHVFSYDDLRPGQVSALLLRARLNLNRVNELALEPFRHITTEQLLDRARTHQIPRGLLARLRGGLALADALIHTQDIRRSLGRPRDVPPERLVPALAMARRSPFLPARKSGRDLQFIANDLDWTAGRGWVLRGPGEALLMAMAGRSVALTECTGPGVPRLRARLRDRSERPESG